MGRPLKLALIATGGKNYPTFDPPFFTGADTQRYFSHKNKQYGPFKDHKAAVKAYLSLLQHEGELR